MDRYKEVEMPKEETRLSRVAKNDSLYDEIKSSKLSRVKADDNVKVIESNTKTIKKILRRKQKWTKNKKSSVSRRR